MNQFSTIAAPRSLDELKSASIKYTKLLHSGAGEELQAFFDEIFDSALVAVAAVDPHEAVLCSLTEPSPLAGKNLLSASRQQVRDEIRTALAPLLLLVYLNKQPTPGQIQKLLILLCAHFGLSPDDAVDEMFAVAKYVGLKAP